MNLIVGAEYRIRLSSGEWTTAVFKCERKTTWLHSRTMTHYVFRNVRTGREIEIKSKARIKPASSLP